MRRHSLLARYAPFTEAARFLRVVQAPYLIAARLQPSSCNWPQGWVDLVFARDEEIVLVPFVQIDPAMLSLRESSPFLWPAWLPLEEPIVLALEALLEPWLLSHALLAGMSREQIGFFTSDPQARDAFAYARQARFLCAAPVDDVLTDAAPYIYAQRFAKSRRVGIASDDCALGASLLAGSAASVHADLGSQERNERARAWYGLGVYGELPRATYDVGIAPAGDPNASVSISLVDLEAGASVVKVARPLFASVACSFDLQDGPEARRFGVRSRQPILRKTRLIAAPVIGGSQGRILVVIRDNGLTAPDADIDQAHALVDALNAQGFQARISVATGARAEDADLIHLIGYRHAHQFAYILDEAKRLNVPVVVTPLVDDCANEALWGTTAIRSMLTGVRDDQAQGLIESGMVNRRILVGGANERGSLSYNQDAVARMFSQARALVFASEQEERFVREHFGAVAPSRVVASVPAVSPREVSAIGELCGLDEYILMHGLIEPRGNQFLAARAAAAAGIPLVVLGAVTDVDYYYAVLGVGGEQFVVLSDDALAPGAIEALYAGARVYTDLSWAGHGAARLVRAAAYGALPVISTALPYAEWWPDVAGGVDPASLESATAVLRQAWVRAPARSHQIAERTAGMADPLRALQAVLGAYAQAAELKSTTV